MSTVELPLISVQTDWDQVVREVVSDKASNSFFWIACYLTGLTAQDRSEQIFIFYIVIR